MRSCAGPRWTTSTGGTSEPDGPCTKTATVPISPRWQSTADHTTHDDVRNEHNRVIDAGGYGVPTLFFERDDGSEHALFGPVLIDPPMGDAALRLWDAVTAWVEFPFLYELQQPKQKRDERAIAETFAPYLNARDWVSINRGVEVGFTKDGFEAVGPADRERS